MSSTNNDSRVGGASPLDGGAVDRTVLLTPGAAGPSLKSSVPVADATTLLSQAPDSTVVLSSFGPSQGSDATTLLRPSASGTSGNGSLSNVAVGDRISLSGFSLSIVSMLATGGAEAKTYIVNDGAKNLVLKVYHRQDSSLEVTLRKISSSSHPNIVRVLGVGSESGKTWELMEYKVGGTLADLIKSKGPLRDVDPVKHLLRAIVSGLKHLHDDLRVVYQDLKPDNILLPDGDVAKAILTDFGISSQMTEGSDAIEVVANGTRDYAAPELSRFGATHTVTVSSKVDYFALGVTLLEAWIGNSPFQGESDGKRRDLILARSIPMPKGMPDSLKELVLGLLEPVAGSRFGAREVDAWLNGKMLQAPPAVRKYPDARFDEVNAYNSPKVLAALMLNNLGRAEQLLFDGGVLAWLRDAGDFELVGAMQTIVDQCKGSADARRAGVFRAIYRLNSQLPFTTAGGRSCSNLEDLGAALREERSHYERSLVSWRDPVYAYLHGQMAKDLADEALNKFQEGGSRAAYALNHLIYSLERGDSPKVRLAGRMVEDPDLIGSDPALRAAFEDEIRQDHSPSMMWLRDCGLVRGEKALRAAPAEDVLLVLMMFPWLKLEPSKDDLTQQRKNTLFSEAVMRNVQSVVRLSDAGVTLKDVAPESIPLSQLVGTIAKGSAPAEVQDTLEFLIGQGVELNVRNGQSHTPLIEAVRQGHVPLVKKLLSHGAKIEFPAADGLTPLASAVESLQDFSSPNTSSTKMVEALLEAGADPLVMFPQRSVTHNWVFRGTIFDWAVRRRDEGLVRLLKKARRYSETRALACGHPAILAGSTGWKEGVALLYPSTAFRLRVAMASITASAMKAVAWFVFLLACMPAYVLVMAPSGRAPGVVTAPFMQWNIWVALEDAPFYWGLLIGWGIFLGISLFGLWMKGFMSSADPGQALKEALKFVSGNKLVFAFILPMVAWFLPAAAGMMVFFAVALALNLYETNDVAWIANIDFFALWLAACIALGLLMVAIGLVSRRVHPTAALLKQVVSSAGNAKSPSGRFTWLWVLIVVVSLVGGWFYLVAR